MSIKSYAEISALCELSVMFLIWWLISFEKPFISFKYGKKHILCALPACPFKPFSDVSISLPKIAREYNKILVEDISFKELLKALKNEDGRRIVTNYGLDPKLGKYHRTYCEVCEKNIPGPAPVTKCDTCDSRNITMGVYDRIQIIKDKKESKSPANRPEYVYQIPLSFCLLLHL